MRRLSVVIPAYNEKDNIGPLVEDIKGALSGLDFEIILVDDNSSDETAQICDKLSEQAGIICIHRKKGDNGMGAALIDGSKAASGKIIFWVMGDRSDKLESIREMLEKLEGDFDMVFASRYMNGGSRGELGVDKAVYGSTYTRLAKVLFNIPVHDITNAFRGFRREVFEGIELESKDFAISPEFAIKAQMSGYRLGQVPTTYFNRRAGVAKFNIIKMGIRYISLFRLKFTYRK